MEMETAPIAISIISLAVSVVAVVLAYKASARSNAIAREQADTALKAFEADHIPVLRFHSGSATDLVTVPATRVFTLIVQNVGHVGIVLTRVGFIFWNGEDFQAPSYSHPTGSQAYPFPGFPHELLPRMQLSINMELNDIMSFIKGHQSAEFPEIALYVIDTIGDRYETERMLVSEFMRSLEELEAGSRVDEDDPELARTRMFVRQAGLG
jgi:hypothetical protein